MKTMVTGGAGFIGSRYIAMNKDIECVSYDLASNEGDILCDDRLSAIRLDRFIVRNNIERVVHLAALTSAPDSIKYPSQYWDNNVGGLRCLLNVWKGPLIFASSAAVLEPLNPYALTKCVGENMIYDRQNTVSYRFFNVYGPGAKGGVVRDFIRAAINNQPLFIDGDGEQSREFVYVDDIVRRLDFRDAKRMTLDLGGEESSIIELARNIIAMTHSSSEIKHIGRREGDPMESMSDSVPYDSMSLRLGLTEAINYELWRPS